MNNEVNFFTLFKRFEPTEEQRALLSQATDIHRQIDKENRRVKARFFLPQTVEKELLYEIEQGIAVAYELNGVFLMPRYPTECFNKEYFRQIVKESERVGSVSKGFFDEYSYDFDGEKREILLHLPWGTGGISLLQRAKICETLEQIIESEFGVRYEVRIKQSEGNDEGRLCRTHSYGTAPCFGGLRRRIWGRIRRQKGGSSCRRAPLCHRDQGRGRRSRGAVGRRLQSGIPDP